MFSVSKFLKKIFSTESEQLSASEVEELRSAFKARYHYFKLLLSANNKALEIMTEMEEALKGDRPFGLSFISAKCTAVSVNVFRIIQNMDLLAPGKYKELFDRFREIQDNINLKLSQRKAHKGDKLVIPLSAVDKNMADEVGSKMANVGEIQNHLHLPVPKGFAISSHAYRRFF